MSTWFVDKLGPAPKPPENVGVTPGDATNMAVGRSAAPQSAPAPKSAPQPQAKAAAPPPQRATTPPPAPKPPEPEPPKKKKGWF
ncbi:MAG TPA: hypothetical protein VG943_09265 [Caulobacterales bacterium]|nr:hypothetical protein [Caulobacterales bacterium]